MAEEIKPSSKDLPMGLEIDTDGLYRFKRNDGSYARLGPDRQKAIRAAKSYNALYRVGKN